MVIVLSRLVNTSSLWNLILRLRNGLCRANAEECNAFLRKINILLRHCAIHSASATRITNHNIYMKLQWWFDISVCTLLSYGEQRIVSITNIRYIWKMNGSNLWTSESWETWRICAHSKVDRGFKEFGKNGIFTNGCTL